MAAGRGGSGGRRIAASTAGGEGGEGEAGSDAAELSLELPFHPHIDVYVPLCVLQPSPLLLSVAEAMEECAFEGPGPESQIDLLALEQVIMGFPARPSTLQPWLLA